MSEKPENIEKKQKNTLSLVLLCISAFFSQACIFLYYGFIGPHGQSLGAPPAVQTLLPLAPAIVGIFALVLVGIFADRSGRRKELVLMGLVFATVFNVLMALTASWPTLLIFRIIGGGVYSTVIFLYVVFFVFLLPPEKRGLGVGLYMGLSTAGSFVFSILGGILIQVYGGLYNIVYWVGAILGLLALVSLIPVRVPRIKAAGVSTKGFGTAIRTRGVYYPGLVFLISSMGFLALISATPLVLGAVFGANTVLIGLVFAVQAILTAVGMFIGGALTDKIGPRILMVTGGILAGIVLLTMPFLGVNWLNFAVLVWITTIFWAFTYSAPPTSATASVGHELAGTAVNTVTMLASIGSVVAGLISGIFLGFGWQTAFYIFAVFLIISGIIAFGIPKIKKPEKH